ncbi:MAG TPA: anthranilate synthase component I [Actinobacteria bacterium]|nr:anthranilate synthase component I [Actinomycetota bacterium]
MTERLHIQPDRSAFDQLASEWPLVPVWAELLGDVLTPVGVFPSLAGDGPGVLLESVERSERWGRYSFVAGDPAAVLTVEVDGSARTEIRRETVPLPSAGGEAMTWLRDVARTVRAPRVPELPALTGGLVGYLGYEAAGLLDGSAHPCPDQVDTPAMQFLLVDRAVVFDQWRQRVLLVAYVPAAAGYTAGARALEELFERVRSATAPEPVAFEPSRAAEIAATDSAAFESSVERIKEHILAGDIFQAVLSRRVTRPLADGALAVYRRLRATNPAPYMFLLRMPSQELAGSSPEPLVRVEGRRVLSRPIAGTRPRGATPEEDQRMEAELLADPKERAEHAMLVDLARNDLGKVCRPGTVQPTELMTVERFTRVMHIVSTVEGELRDEHTPLDALAATFPAGTVTGAPKRRAMEIIAEEETIPRGAYAGAVGYVSFAGDLDFCITIRTVVVRGGIAHVQSGAGIVADSDPRTEFEETRAKAAALLPALGGDDA